MSDDALNPEKAVGSSGDQGSAPGAEPGPVPDAESGSAPDAETQEMQALLQASQAAPQEKAPALPEKGTPAVVKTAAILAMLHGALLVCNAVLASRALGDSRLLPYNVIWLGFIILLAGALFERQVWAWWSLTMLGGIAAILNLLKVVGFFVYQTSGIVEDAPTFSPALVGGAGLVMLIAVILLTLTEAKAAFGLTKENPTGLL